MSTEPTPREMREAHAEKFAVHRTTVEEYLENWEEWSPEVNNTEIMNVVYLVLDYLPIELQKLPVSERRLVDATEAMADIIRELYLDWDRMLVESAPN